MRILTDSKKVAARVFPKHYRMFPCGLDSMYAVHPALQSAPIKYQADWLERNLGFLKELDGQLPDTTHLKSGAVLAADAVAAALVDPLGRPPLFTSSAPGLVR